LIEISNLPQISDAEWQVMKVLWYKSPLTASQVISQLEEDTNWSPKTIHTLLNRLVNKEALKVDKSTRPYKYYPLVSQEECVREETKLFLEKVYDGSVGMLLANFIKNEKLSQEEIEELRRLLE
jgi:BlaI family penicillinase repressor